MPNPIRLLAKLTTQSKQIDGMGFGGSTTITKLDVAAVMGMKHADTKESLDRGAYYVARLIFCDDKSSRVHAKANLLGYLMSVDTGNIADETLLKIVGAALREYQNPATKINKISGEQEKTVYSNREIARNVGINHKSLSSLHQRVYSLVVQQIDVLISDAFDHIYSHYKEV
jgi:hypothetical protein